MDESIPLGKAEGDRQRVVNLMWLAAPPDAHNMLEGYRLGLLSRPTVEHRAEPCGRGSGLALVMVDLRGVEHVYVTPNAMELLQRCLRQRTPSS